VWSVGSIILTG